MNYYPFHIGDYVSATRHLSWDEDAAYRRLLDTYYTTEKPLPADVTRVCRLVLASTDAQRAAVATVLEEFFTLGPDGWTNRRADEEIAAMRQKVEASEEKDGHEKTRKQRYRERRAAMFAFLRERGIVPEYDIPMKDLQAMVDAAGTPGTPAGTPPTEGTGTPPERPERPGDVTVDASGTAIPTPTPTPTPKGVQGGTPPKPPAFAVPPWVPDGPWQDFVEMRRAKGKRAPFTVAAAKGILADLQKLRGQGHDVGEVLRQSVVNGWSGVFAPKTEQQGGRGKTGGVDWTGAAT